VKPQQARGGGDEEHQVGDGVQAGSLGPGDAESPSDEAVDVVGRAGRKEAGSDQAALAGDCSSPEQRRQDDTQD